nr:hypothetical protein [uncultured Flavobacterium sp.]
MKRINVLLILLVLFIAPLAHSQIIFRFGLGEQEANGIVFKKDKQQISGEVNFPKFKDKKVKIKVDGKNQKLVSADIDSIQIFDISKKQVYTFVRTKTKRYKSKGTEFKVIDEGWICLIKKGKTSLYLGGLEYGIKKDSMRVVTHDFNYYLKKKTDDFPILVSTAVNGGGIGFNVFFKEYGQYYFSDNPVIVEKIKNKEYKYEDIQKVVDYYNRQNSAVKKPKSDTQTTTTKKKKK